MTVVVGLGDSVSYGIGDAGTDYIGPSWSGRLAHSIGATHHRNYSYPGALSRHLTKIQVPAAIEARPDIVLMSVGGNDALRSSFCADRLSREVRGATERLVDSGAQVVVLGLPDPMKSSPAPAFVRRVLSRRIAGVNLALDAATRGTGAVMMHTWTDPKAYVRAHWHVDRLHPSPIGYQHLAEKAMRMLGLEPVNEPMPVDDEGPNPTWWMLSHATVWFAKRSVDLLPGLVAMSIKARGPLPRFEPPSG